ncbi:MAG: hypothetical protein H8E12_05975 [Rhodobacteraceae bacterium]|nr:hypothetical protein [Paracoccaceae bacterium]
MGTMVESGIRQGTGRKALPESDYVKFYSTPVTNVETGFFDAATGTVKGAIKGEKYDTKKRIDKGFGEAYDNFFGKPVESAGSLVELAPYFGYGAAKAGSRVVGDFFGSFGKTTTKGSKAIGPQKTGNFAQDFFYTKPDKNTIFNLDTAGTMSTKNVNLGRGIGDFFGGAAAKDSGSEFFKAVSKAKKTKGGGTYKEYRATDFTSNFFGPTKTGTVLLQKTKTKVKQKTQNKMVDQFFKPVQKQKVKTKQKLKQKQKVKTDSFFGSFFAPKQSTKMKSKQISLLTPKQSAKQKGKQDFFAGTALKTTGVTKPPVPLKTMGGIPFGLFWGRTAKNTKKKQNKRGAKSFTAWNVDETNVGSFFGGPSYRTSKSTRVFKDADKQNKRAAKKQRKKNNDFITGFFD